MDARMPIGFYEILNKHFPEQCAPGRQGGRPPIKHFVVLKVIWYVEVTGCRWKDVPHEMGCCGETARTRLQAWEQEGIWDDIHQELLALLHKHDALDVRTVIIDSTLVRAFGGGDETGPNPVDRARPGTKFTLAVDSHGVPLVIRVAPANKSDHNEIIPTVLDIPEIGGKPGPRKEHPDDAYADAGYDSEAIRQILRFLGITPHIRHKTGEHGSHLGRVRWVVERTISWIKGLRRMRFRYDRTQTAINACATLAAAMVCFQLASEFVS
jgi:transposase